MTEQELASRCARGDDAARKELYMTYSPRLLSLCRRYADNDAEAEDMMQDAFIKIFSVIGRFVWTRPGSLYSWMARVALNQAFDSARKRRRLAREMMDIEVLPDVQSDEPDYDETAAVPFDELQKMIAALPEGCQTIFKLYCIDGLSHKEIASLLDIKEKSSSSGLARARASLARAIRKYLNENKQFFNKNDVINM
ncbi:MAG: RNA polymerase sigma factor [Bacteroidales bacterium]|nr:RNA polymerase sigma factor [Bacteroidales bacterium]